MRLACNVSYAAFLALCLALSAAQDNTTAEGLSGQQLMNELDEAIQAQQIGQVLRLVCVSACAPEISVAHTHNLAAKLWLSLRHLLFQDPLAYASEVQHRHRSPSSTSVSRDWGYINDR